MLSPKQRHRLIALGLLVAITAEIASGFAWLGGGETSERERWWVVCATAATAVGTLCGALLLFRLSVRQGRVDAEKLAAVELERANRLAEVGQLVAGIAHEIHNPLQGVNGYLALIEREAADAEKRKAHVGAARAALGRIEKLTRDLLEYANPSAVHRVDVSVYDLFQSLKRFLAADDRFANIQIECDAAGAMPTLRCDAAGVERVLLNLLLNAREALAGKGSIALRARYDARAVVLSVEDDGPGVPERLRPHLFQPFRSGRGSSGLGLWISANLARANGAVLTYDASYKKGARFVLTFPHSSPPSDDGR